MMTAGLGRAFGDTGVFCEIGEVSPITSRGGELRNLVVQVDVDCYGILSLVKRKQGAKETYC